MTIALFTLLTILWGGSYLAVHYALVAYPPLLAAALRVGIAMPPIALLALYSVRSSWFKGSAVPMALVSGVIVLGVPQALIFFGEQFVPPALVAIIFATVPFFTILFLPLLNTGACVTRYQWMGAAMGLLGVMVIFAPALSNGFTLSVVGLLAILGAALSYGVGTAMLQAMSQRMPPIMLLTWQVLAGFFFLFFCSALTETWPSLASVSQAHAANGALVYLGLGSTALAFWIWIKLIQGSGGVLASQVTFTIPLVSLALDAYALGNIPSGSVFVGAGAVLAGVMVSRHAATASKHLMLPRDGDLSVAEEREKALDSIKCSAARCLKIVG